MGREGRGRGDRDGRESLRGQEEGKGKGYGKGEGRENVFPRTAPESRKISCSI